MKTANLLSRTIIGLFILISLEATAQKTLKPSIDSYEYKDAIGLRAGETSGFIYTHKFNRDNAFEAILSAWPYSIGLTGLFEKYYKTGAPGLYLYFGGGAHVNTGTRVKRYYWYRNNEYVISYRSNVFAIGGDGIFGIEYKFSPVPIAISTDFKPFIEGNNYGDTYFSLDPGITVKFTF